MKQLASRTRAVVTESEIRQASDTERCKLMLEIVRGARYSASGGTYDTPNCHQGPSAWSEQGGPQRSGHERKAKGMRNAMRGRGKAAACSSGNAAGDADGVVGGTELLAERAAHIIRN